MGEKETAKIEKSLMNELRRLVVLKYGKVHGCLNREINEALSKRIEELKTEISIGG